MWSGACPRCRQSDQVRRVADVVGPRALAGAPSETLDDSADSIEAEVQPSVAAGRENSGAVGAVPLNLRLAPPAQPRWESPWQGFRGFWSVAALLLSPLVGIVAYVWLSGAGPVAPLGLPIGLALGLGIPALVVYLNHVEAGRRRAAVQRAMPRWEVALQRWQRLHYCRWCDVVFLTGQPQVAPADRMGDFLYGSDRR